ncbi:MAG TPA: hypothetical protein QGH10_08255, partial [Armatimonadota bacterium]|nr:hypothetical protein [Armatimonadota bacterium]
AQARAATQDIRNAIGLFQTQCGDYPTSLTDLIASSPSPTGAHGVEIDPLSWHGPYLDALGGLPANPITGGNVGGADWIYTPATGAVHAAGLDDPPADLDW